MAPLDRPEAGHGLLAADGGVAGQGLQAAGNGAAVGPVEQLDRMGDGHAEHSFELRDASDVAGRDDVGGGHGQGAGGGGGGVSNQYTGSDFDSWVASQRGRV